MFAKVLVAGGSGVVMDWETNERTHASAVVAALVLICLSFLFFKNSSFVKQLRSMLQLASRPTHQILSDFYTPPESEAVSAAQRTSSPETAEPASPAWVTTIESHRAVVQLQHENQRLREVLGLRAARWPKGIAAHVTGRDPQRWFQEIVIDRGRQDGVVLESPVVAVLDGREGFVGRVVEVMERTSKVALIQDSLSAVAARLVGSAAEDGVVEGGNSHELILKYLDRNSPIKIGDAVVTAGLGAMIPPEIPIGWVVDISLDPRQLFLQARLRPVIATNRLSVVLILVPNPS